MRTRTLTVYPENKRTLTIFFHHQGREPGPGFELGYIDLQSIAFHFRHPGIMEDP